MNWFCLLHFPLIYWYIFVLNRVPVPSFCSLAVWGLQLDLMIFKVFSNINDSLILSLSSSFHWSPWLFLESGAKWWKGCPGSGRWRLWSPCSRRLAPLAVMTSPAAAASSPCPLSRVTALPRSCRTPGSIDPCAGGRARQTGLNTADVHQGGWNFTDL